MPADTVPLNGFALRALRRAKRLKQQHVALIADISPSYYSELESSAKVNVSLDVFRGLVTALDLAPEDERAISRFWVADERAEREPAA